MAQELKIQEKAVEVKASKAATKAKVKKETTPAKPAFRDAYRLAYYTKSGGGLFLYTLSVFTLLGGFTDTRNPMKIADVKAFYDTDTVVKYHVGTTGNLEKVEGKAGYIRLSVAGLAYFKGRLTGQTANQAVDAGDVEVLVRALSTGKMEKTAHYGSDAQMRKVIISA